jgi:hypothetical protein
MIVLIQTNIHGHRAEYIDHALSWAEKNGHSVLVWIKQATLEAAKKRFPLSDLVSEVRVGEFQDSDIMQLVKSGKISRLVFLDGDLELTFALRNLWHLSKLRSVFLLMRLNYPSSPRIGTVMIYFIKYSIAFFLNLLPSTQMKRLVFLRKRKFSFLGQVRDPLPKTEAFPKPRKSNDTMKYVGIVGTLDERKSIELAVSSINELGVGYQLNLVGQATEGFKPELTRLTSNSPAVHLKEKYLSESEMSREIASLDCFLVLQRMNIPSGTLLRALDAGVPAVVGGANLLKVTGAEFQDSIIWTKLRTADVAVAIEAAVSRTPGRVGSIPGPSDFAMDLLG